MEKLNFYVGQRVRIQAKGIIINHNRFVSVDKNSYLKKQPFIEGGTLGKITDHDATRILILFREFNTISLWIDITAWTTLVDPLD